MKTLIVLLLLALLPLAGQQLENLEAEHQALLVQVSENESKLQTLQRQLESRAAEIDAMKNRSSAESGDIAAQMSDGIALTREISLLKAELAADREALTAVQLSLVEQYSVRIDSLEAALRSADSDEQRAQLKKQLQLNTEKYLQVSPAVSLLKIDPGKIKALQTGAEDDSLAALFYRGYLQSALQDIDAQLTIINDQHSELEASVQLAENARDFMEEIDGQILSPLFSASTDIQAQSEELIDNFGTGRETGSDVSISASLSANSVEKYQALHALLRQLDSFGNSSLLDVDVEGADINITPENYLALLKEAQKRLQLYRNSVAGKLQEAGE